MEREKVHRVVEGRQLTSFSNNTRWNSLLSELRPHRLKARLKHVAWPEMSGRSGWWIVPSANYLEVESAGPVHFREIEWIDFDCAESYVTPEQLVVAVGSSKLTAEVAINSYEYSAIADRLKRQQS
jgi:hypothetical protein